MIKVHQDPGLNLNSTGSLTEDNNGLAVALKTDGGLSKMRMAYLFWSIAPYVTQGSSGLGLNLIQQVATQDNNGLTTTMKADNGALTMVYQFWSMAQALRKVPLG